MVQFKPHAYQDYCIQKIIDTKKIGLFLDMGLGKTVTTLTAIRELKCNRFEIRKVLIIAPKKVAEGTWTREKDKWEHTKILRVSQVLGSQAKRIRALNTPADLYITNRENVVWLVDYYRNAWPFDMVVIDESSSFKSHNAKRFKALASVSGHIDRLVELTGTPSPNGLNDLWSQVYLLDGGERLGKRYTQFREHYFDPGDRGQNVIYNYKPKQGSEESIMAKISDICVSMKAEDYLQLPPVTFHEVPVVLDAKAKKAYQELEKKMILELPEEEEISVTSAAALSNKLLQLSNGAVYDDDHNVHRQRIIIFAGAAKEDSFKKIRGNSYGMWIATEINLHHKAKLNIPELQSRMQSAVSRQMERISGAQVRVAFAGTGNGTVKEQTIYTGPEKIEVPVVLEGREIARVTAPYMDKKLDDITNRKTRGGV